MNKKLAIIVNIDAPQEILKDGDQFIKLMHDYMMLMRFTTEVEQVHIFPINYKLRIEHLELPNPLVN